MEKGALQTQNNVALNAYSSKNFKFDRYVPNYSPDMTP